ncbi:hypothetical protein C8J57DRAFT_1294417 [Mycena rebaudengoi]|nr:hypothetical protein C8J57DRAFT_1294417 [Mycena rebaudengoi]
MPPGSAGERQRTSHGPAPTRSRAPAGFVGSQIRDATRSVRRPPFYQAHVCASTALNAFPRRGTQSLPDPVVVCMPTQCCTSRTCVSFSRRAVAARLQSPGITTSAQPFCTGIGNPRRLGSKEQRTLESQVQGWRVIDSAETCNLAQGFAR